MKKRTAAASLAANTNDNWQSLNDPDRHLLIDGDLYRRIMSLGARIAMDPSSATVAEHMELANLRARFWGTDLSFMGEP